MLTLNVMAVLLYNIGSIFLKKGLCKSKLLNMKYSIQDIVKKKTGIMKFYPA